MTSVIVPPVDLAPGMPSRVVTISATDVTEGGQSLAGQMVRFALSDSLDVTSGGDVIAKSQAEVVLDSNGNGSIRLPVYNDAVKTWCGDPDWAILVTTTWGSQKAIRVPAGTTTIALSALPPVRPLRGREKQWAVTGAGITIVEGSQWGASVSLEGGVLRFVITVPPGGTAWWKGMLGASANIDTLEDGAYGFFTGVAAGEAGMPEALTGVLESYQTAGVQLFHVKTTGEQRTWQRSNFSSGWTTWERIDGNSWYKGPLDKQTGTLATIKPGLYLVRYTGTGETWGLPQNLIGQLEVLDAGGQRQVFYRPNDAGAGLGTKMSWELSTNSGGVLRDRWQRVEKAIMRTSPVVLTAPAGEYTQVTSRGAVRIPFTVPTTVGKVRVHMRPWNYRTETEWGPALLGGVMIAQQDSGGSITGSRWYAPDASGTTVPGGGWTSGWFHVGLTEGATYLLSYSAEWQDASRELVMGQCWSSEDTTKWDTLDAANYASGWGEFALQPMDIWIECEAPSTVPVWGYVGASNTMGMSAPPSVFGAYPNLHARKNKVFAALTAAGGWSIMDASVHKQNIVRRFGYPARMLDRLYVDLGSNIEVRGATLPEAQAELTRWLDVNKTSFGSPLVYVMTQIPRADITETTTFAGTLSPWNEWIRYEVTKRDEVRGLIDFAAIFADPKKPWTARDELRASPTDVHFGTNGQRMRAQALDGEIHLPFSAARNASELATSTGLLSAYLAARGA